MIASISTRASVLRNGGRHKPDFGFSLEHFVLRSKVLSLYRQFVRASRPMGDLNTRLESLAFFRSDFEKLRQMTDTECIKQFLLDGQRTLKQMSNTSLLVGREGPKLRGLRQKSP